MEKSRLSQLSDFEVYRPDIEFFVDKINNLDYFGFCKLNEGFWEAVAVAYHRDFKGAADSYAWFKNHGMDLFFDLLIIVNRIPASGLLLGVSHIGPPVEGVYMGMLPYERKLAAIKQVIPPDYTPLFGCLWKQYIVDRVMHRFLAAIRNLRVVTVGLPHLEQLGTVLNFPNFRHYSVGLYTAGRRHEYLADLRKLHTSEPSVYLFQAGECMCTWLIYNLRDLPNAFLIDLGRSLDYFLPGRQMKADDLRQLPDFNGPLWMQLVPQGYCEKVHELGATAEKCACPHQRESPGR